MYDGRVACCPLVSHGEYVDGTDRQMERRSDARPLHYASSIDAASIINTRAELKNITNPVTSDISKCAR